MILKITRNLITSKWSWGQLKDSFLRKCKAKMLAKVLGREYFQHRTEDIDNSLRSIGITID
jgi:hypothetical protein